MHHVLLELLMLVGGPEVRGGKVLMSNYFLIYVRILGVVLKVEAVVASEEGLGGGEARVGRLGFLVGRGFCWLGQWLQQGGL